MSGGRYDYAFGPVEHMAVKMDKGTPLRRAFAAHLIQVANAMHEIEWADSGDTELGNLDVKAMSICLGPHAELRQLVTEANAARDALAECLSQTEVPF